MFELFLVCIFIYLVVKYWNGKEVVRVCSIDDFNFGQNIKIQKPKDYEIYKENCKIMGINTRKQNAKDFIEFGGDKLKFLPEPNNVFDANAIKVIGVVKQGTLSKEFELGYLDKDTASDIARGNIKNKVIPILNRIYVSEDNYFYISFDIYMKKGYGKYYISQYNKSPAGEDQLEFLKYFKIKYNASIKTEQANKLIDESKKHLTKKQLKEYELYLFLVNELIDNYKRQSIGKEYGIKKPRKKMIKDTVEFLVNKGYTCDEIEDDLDMFVDCLKELEPSLKIGDD